MGKLLKPRGLKGELNTSIFNEYESTLKTGTIIWLKTNEENYFSRKIESIKLVGEKSYIKLSDCNCREDSKKVQGLVFFLSRDSFDPINDNEHYLVDMINSKVVDESQKYLGAVTDVLLINTQNIIVVETEGKEILIPYVDAHIMLFDKKKKIIRVKDVEDFIN